MDNHRVRRRVYLKKTRRITSCSECYRRKQKCDRQQPCHACTSRGVSRGCTYATPSSPQLIQSPVSRGSIEHDVTFPLIDQSSMTTVESGLGYVNTDESRMLPASTALIPGRLRLHRHQNASTIVPYEVYSEIARLLDYIPEPSLMKRLADVFFSQANWYFSVLDRCFFDQRFRQFWIWHRRRAEQKISCETCGFAALQLQVVAIALHFLPYADRLDETIITFIQSNLDSKSQACSEAGDSILALLKRRYPSVSSVEADIMRCAWLKNSGHGLDAWHSLSNAIRQAQDLKLHLEPVTQISEDTSFEYLGELWHFEHQRRIWACLLAWDAHMALQLGRPRMINLADCTVRRPTLCDCPKDLSRTILRRSDVSADSPTHYTSHMVKYELALLIHQAMDNVMLGSEERRAQAAMSIESEVTLLVSKLPSAFQKVNPDTSWDVLDPCIPKLRLQIQIIVDSLLLALHRPHVLANDHSLKAAVGAAQTVLNNSQELFEMVEENQHKTFTLVFYTIDAGIFLMAVLTMLKANDIKSYIPPELLIKTLGDAVRRLHFLEKFHAVARAGRRILENCLSHFQTIEQSSATSQKSTKVPFMGGPGADATDTNAFWPYNVDDDEFWSSLIRDAGSTTSWLDSYLNAFNPELDAPAIGSSNDEVFTT